MRSALYEEQGPGVISETALWYDSDISHARYSLHRSDKEMDTDMIYRYSKSDGPESKVSQRYVLT